MASSASIQAQIDALNTKIKSLPNSLAGIALGRPLQAQLSSLQSQLATAQKNEAAAQKVVKPATTTTPISKVAESAPAQPTATAQTTTASAAQSASPTSDFLSKVSGYDVKSLFPNVDSKTGLPILSKSGIDTALKNSSGINGGNYLDAQQYRDNYDKFGWNAKSDASSVANGAAALGLRKNMASLGTYNYLNENNKPATDDDFKAAAAKAGVDLAPFYGRGPSLGSGIVLDKAKAYQAIQDASKDLYKVTNTIGGDNHASILFKDDGKGNLMPVSNPQTGAPTINYFNAVRNDMSGEGFLGGLAPVILPAAAMFAAPYVAEAFGLPGSWSAANQAAGLGTSAAGTLSPEVAATIGTTSALPVGQTMAMNPNAVVGSANTAGTVGDVIGGGAGSLAVGANAIGTGAAGSALGNALTNSAIAQGIGSALGAGASIYGANAQAEAAKQAAANQMAMFNTINQQYAPQRGAGYQALNQIRSMLPGQYQQYDETGKPIGMATGTDYLTRQFTPQDLQAGLAPNYQFMLGQGQQQAQRQANLAGGAIGGNALRALQDYTQNYAGNAYQNAFQNFQNQRTGIYNTLAGIAGLGQQAQTATGQAGQAATTAQGQLGVGSAAAQAAGLTGAANAVSGGLQNYQNAQILQAILAQNQNIAQQNQG